MAAEIITRALLKQYLRATEWRCEPRQDHPLDPAWLRGDGERMLGINGGLPSFDALAAFHRTTQTDLAARLGLCAAAEEAREQVVGCLRKDCETCACATGLAAKLLRMAGVDLERWEEERHG